MSSTTDIESSSNDPTSISGFHPTLTHWNPLEPAELANPYPTYAQARHEAPIFYSQFFGGWVVTRYDDIQAVVKDTKTFSNSGSLGPAIVPDEARHLLPNGYPWAYPSLENNDPPCHTRIRRRANEAFKSSVIAAEEPNVVRITDELFSRFERAGQVEFMGQFANLLPGYALCEVLGVPRSMTEQVVQWADEVVALLDPNIAHDELMRIAENQANWYKFCEEFIGDRRANPGDDVMSGLISARVDDEPALSDRELISTFCHFLIGGNETTRRFLGTLILCLLDHPDQMAAVSADRRLIEPTIQETLRYMSSVRGLYRTATADVELGGVRIPEGAPVVLMWASANHDDKFEAPETFNIFRKHADRHLAFSRGAHFCIGAPFALLESRVVLNAVFDRMPGLRRADDKPLKWTPGVLHSGVETLHLAWNVI
ncbi:cytochrome P450 [Mycobacterium sp.]|uniref:cytochrome P450 n=1 Tax=Mycobacterium sp. TaxID=1785 RepID=UPI002B685E22|nr:cytochrome P450 [Mycobacterium sp.]HKP42743.1 cytochrome P450 [Mycobacterium sp.]